MIPGPRNLAAPVVTAMALAVGACGTPIAPSPGPDFVKASAEEPWVAWAPRTAAEILALAHSAAAPTTLRTESGVRHLDHRGLSPQQIVTDYTTGDYSEVLTDDAKNQFVSLIEVVSTSAGGTPYESVDVAPCADDGLGADTPDEAWHDAAGQESFARSCVHVSAKIAGDDVVAESLELLVVGMQIPSGRDTAGMGATSRITLLDEELLHAIGDSGLPWQDYLASTDAAERS